ncbi:hypothetical protein PUN28_003368 [Cardiocondyla obscurior]|uniref:Ribosomal protein S7 n=1 Tax=Cardiocondyla obscurior TaxID=286306 RepID=A0AAW2GLP2_9HYME
MRFLLESPRRRFLIILVCVNFKRQAAPKNMINIIDIAARKRNQPEIARDAIIRGVNDRRRVPSSFFLLSFLFLIYSTHSEDTKRRIKGARNRLARTNMISNIKYSLRILNNEKKITLPYSFRKLAILFSVSRGENTVGTNTNSRGYCERLICMAHHVNIANLSDRKFRGSLANEEPRKSSRER